MDYEESREATLFANSCSVYVYSDWNHGRSSKTDWKHEVTPPVCIFEIL